MIPVGRAAVIVIACPETETRAGRTLLRSTVFAAIVAGSFVDAGKTTFSYPVGRPHTSG